MPDAMPTWDNQLMAALPADTWARCSPHLSLGQLVPGQVLCRPGEELRSVYFPTHGLVSLLQVLQDGSSTEIAVVGREGMVGTGALLPGGNATTRCVVHVAGAAYRLPAQVLLSEFARGDAAMHTLLRYLQALFSQMAQTAACNRHHSIEQQLCRWLLLGLDRVGGHEVAMTQELLAGLLGVRREGVTHAATRLQRLGVIRYSRGRIEVLDRAALERHSCECYQAVRQVYADLGAAPHPA